MAFCFDSVLLDEDSEDDLPVQYTEQRMVSV